MTKKTIKLFQNLKMRKEKANQNVPVLWERETVLCCWHLMGFMCTENQIRGLIFSLRHQTVDSRGQG